MNLMNRSRSILAALAVLVGLNTTGVAHALSPNRTNLGINRPIIQEEALGHSEIVQVNLWLDGQLVSPTWDESGRVEYVPPSPLAPGEHRVKLERTDRDGNTWTEEAVFNIVPGAVTELPDPFVSGLVALGRVNQHRAVVGLPPLTYNKALGAAAAAHASYVYNHGYDVKHWQEPEHKDFIGRDADDRARYFGFFRGAGEVIHYTNDPIRAVEGWMETLYHRLPLIDPRVTEMGFFRNKADVLVMAGRQHATEPVLWPFPEQQGVPPEWDGREWPDPRRLHPTAPEGPWGYTITMQFPHGEIRDLVLEQGRLTDALGTSLAVMHFDPQMDSHLDQEVAMIPHQPLKPNSRYTAHMKGRMTVDGVPTTFDWTWSFQTGAKRLKLVWSMTGWGTNDIQAEISDPVAGLQVFADRWPVEGLKVEGNNVSFQLPAHLRGSYDELLFMDMTGRFDILTGHRQNLARRPEVKDGSVSFLLDGRAVQLPALITPDGTALVAELDLESIGITPVENRGGATYAWNAGNRQAEVGDDVATAWVNGWRLIMDYPVLEMDGEIYLPQALVEALLGTRMASGSTPPALVTDAAGHPAEHAIRTVVAVAPVALTENGAFRPDEPLTRAGFLKLAAAALELPVLPGGPTNLVDGAHHWVGQEGYLGAALAAGLIRSEDYTDRRLEPDRSITVQEVATVLERAQPAQRLKIGALQPDKTATRADAALLLEQLLKNRKK